MRSSLKEVLCGASRLPSGPAFLQGAVGVQAFRGHNARLLFHMARLRGRVHLGNQKSRHMCRWCKVCNGKPPAATHYTLQRYTSVVKGRRHPLCVISRAVKPRSALCLDFFTPVSSVKGFLRNGADWPLSHRRTFFSGALLCKRKKSGKK